MDDFVSNFHYKTCIKAACCSFCFCQKMKRVKINTNGIIFYLDINFYIHVLVFKLNICFLIF